MGDRILEKALVVFTGWGFKRDIWKGLVESIGEGFSLIYSEDKADLEDAVERGIELYVMGWSKGGMEAIEFAIQNPERVSKAVLFSTTARFVRGGGYRLGWKKGVVERMKLALLANPKAVLDEFTQNIFSESDMSRKSVQTLLKSAKDYYLVKESELGDGLDYLLETDLREVLGLLEADTLLVCGSDDAIVSAKASAYIEGLSGGLVEVDLLEGVGHAPFISEQDYCARRALNFLRGESHDR